MTHTDGGLPESIPGLGHLNEEEVRPQIAALAPRVAACAPLLLPESNLPESNPQICTDWGSNRLCFGSKLGLFGFELALFFWPPTE